MKESFYRYNDKEESVMVKVDRGYCTVYFIREGGVTDETIVPTVADAERLCEENGYVY